MDKLVVAKVNTGMGNELRLFVRRMEEDKVTALQFFRAGNDLAISSLIVRGARQLHAISRMNKFDKA
jgi:hypothetical protein